MTDYPRLDDRCIEDPIIRTMLHREILARAADRSIPLREYEISGDEIYRPDLAAQRAYGNHVLRWVITLLAGNDDESQPLPQGETLRLPDVVWIRERIRHYSAGGGVE